MNHETMILTIGLVGWALFVSFLLLYIDEVKKVKRLKAELRARHMLLG